MGKRTAVLGVDIQNDFTNPQGNLYVNGADNDIRRIYTFIEECGRYIDYIAMSLDSHQPIHIATQGYWRDIEGYPPALFTTITAEDVANQKWYPQYNIGRALDYLTELEKHDHTCTIWPSHCVEGSWGWAINELICKSLQSWCLMYNRKYELFFKGMHQATEHYSIFKSLVEFPECPETKFNTFLLEKLNVYDQILIMGEAADYCVINSIHDMIHAKPSIAEKTIMLTDCMSWIDKDNGKAIDLYQEAYSFGVRFMTTEEFKEQELCKED